MMRTDDPKVRGNKEGGTKKKKKERRREGGMRKRREGKKREEVKTDSVNCGSEHHTSSF